VWAYLILGIALLVIGALIARWFTSANPSRLARILKWLGIGLAGALALFLAVTGKPHLSLLPLGLVLLPTLLARFGGRFPHPGGTGRPRPGQSSRVETLYLRMTLDHDSGEMSGEVLSGRFEGKSLQEMSLADHIELFDECRRHDAQSAQLLEAYLDRVHGAKWRKRAGEGPRTGEAPRTEPPGAMTAEEAREILGVEANATPEEIKAAHHRLMMKLHPDQGGSTYLASKINQAKEVLLKA
jgi:hypothetical protein